MLKRSKHSKKIHWGHIISLIMIIVGIYLMISGAIGISKEIIKRDLAEQEAKEERQNVINQLDEVVNKIHNLEDKTEDLSNKVENLENSKVTSRSSKTRTADNNSEYIAFEATGYCPCKQCCGKTNGITASGVKATANHTVAMNSNYKFGTKIEIKGMGTYTVEDRRRSNSR